MKHVILALLVVAVAAGAARAQVADPRKVCTDAMNADPKFANDIVAIANKDLATQIHNYDVTFAKLQDDANAKIAKNEKHVILAYAAIWVAAAAFLLFLWRRQQGLKDRIEKLTRELDAALAAEKKEKTT